MLKNYFIIAWRNLIRQKSFSLINILGLSFGLASCLILMAFVKHERSYDAFHQDSERVFRVVQTANQKENWSWTGGAVAPMLRNAFPEDLEQAVSVHLSSSFISNPEGSNPEESFREDNFIFSDAGFDQVFDFELRQGSWNDLLENPNQLAITYSAASKYFGKDNPIDKTLLVDGTAYVVKAVLEDLPSNTHMKFDFITGMASFKSLNGFPYTAEFGSFWWPQVYTYAKVKPGISPGELSQRIVEVNDKYRNPEEAKNYIHYLQPLTKIHLDDSMQSDWTPIITERTLWIFLSIGLFVLILAAINFVNLATARAIKRMKEIGIRKVNGAKRAQLIGQFLAESLVINGISMVSGLGLVYLTLPVVRTAMGMEIPFDPFQDLELQVLLFFVWIASSLLSGIFPAFYLSGLNPEMILKQSPVRSGKSYIRKGLVVFQFVLSTLLVFCATVAYFQHGFMTQSSMGFEPENILTIRLGTKNENSVVLKQELEKINGISSVRLTSDQPGIQPGWGPSVDYPGMPPGEMEFLRVQYIDKNYFEALGIPMLSGREFSDEFNDKGIKSMIREQFPALDGVGMIINESAVKWMNNDLESVIGADLRVFTEENGQLYSNYKGNVIGVVKDYHTQDLRVGISPTVYLPAINDAFDGSRYLVVKGDKAFDELMITDVKSKWENINAGLPFDINFLEDSIIAQYKQEEKTGNLLGFFALLTLIISAMGLLGLSIFTAESRKKEIGIRKVLGASISKIVNQLSGEFLVPVVFSLLIALPLGYYLMSEWLSQFAYKIPISWDFFLGAAAISVGVAYLTVTFQSLKTARANPVESIRNE
ncbi:MAG: ABC transporter permease [Mongoliibacter sp.]|uniref:ABC transporter permease n=1 Tax=Mongoliibacter sp. TaxID=2022438 RepID=UPI0012F42CD5|nr:ABC transporter permease [Mongoliibacter sp.]TVP53456.1 MAG: ABC transporter permease [Mongoliibacter sp.]